MNQEAETHTLRVMVLEGVEESACHAHGWILVLIVIVSQDGNVSDSCHLIRRSMGEGR